MYIITNKIGRELNYYCGIVNQYGETVGPSYKGAMFESWDTDIKFVQRFESRLGARKKQSILRRLIGSEHCKVSLYTKYSKN